MKLYYLPGACSFVPHTALEWIGKPYEAEAVNRDKIKSPEYLALNPQGAVPLLVDGDFALSQNIAILTYLDNLHPEAKLFGSNTAQDKAKAMRWLSFFNSDVHKALTAEIRQNAADNVLRMLEIANDHLEHHAFFGERLCVTDVYLYTMLGWAKRVGLDVSHLTHFKSFIERVEVDKGVDAVRVQEGLK
ncbi:glutathione S-transferase N-terminal domain-containing protein [Glaesserella parasuis]|uniref:glutathione S-transferase family protein n=1 Tax=Glaesserella parasuis TaxID=738 RepID=UPI00094F4AFF|nr:glutathione S-transferase N-terminal domain-containing protein [Glaesserella parasuis]MDG6346799.1 glutathione S-transferase N-terminal domain-containing protein [Glaesserella parasuis]MDO9874428.1 glutathione S-transferase N-terminal domain-containing protein [Glaesserella parasuis]MDO9914242.1 glutathione S-transferase N-terminal domain-containing protein [Glaesserella parasuis]MDP0351542.1 glutathione S-transferase N-terminal domain-containing protein [Glaesserella parasuis]MWQ33779.1 gl